MLYTKDQLQQSYSLSFENVEATLVACDLPVDQDEYTDDEIKTRFEVIYQLVQQGKTYKQAAAQFHRQEKKRSPKSEFPSMNILEMLTHLKSEYGMDVELTEAINLLGACGLSPNQKEYRQIECDRFLEACDLIKEQGYSYDQVSNHFGTAKVSGSQQEGNNVERLVDQVSESAAASEIGLVNLVSGITEKQAERIPGLVNEMYINQVISKLAQNNDEITDFYAGLEERILGRIEGKSPIKAIMEGKWEPIQKELPSSSEKLMLSPAELENNINTD